MPLRRLLVLTLLLTPMLASAMETQTWNFQNGQMPENFQTSHPNALSSQPEGLFIRASGVVQLLGQRTFPMSIDVVSLSTVSSKPIQARLLWHTAGAAPNSMLQLPFFITQGAAVTDIPLTNVMQWDPNADLIGISVSDADVLLLEMRFSSWNMFEKSIEMWKSFWSFDRITPYSINFLWGPVLAPTPVGREQLYTNQPPPRGWSANRVFYVVIAVAGVGLLLHRRLSASRKITVFLAVFAAMWAIFDLRMGWELLRYANNDYGTYILPLTADKDLRGMGGVYETIRAIRPILERESAFVMHTPAQSYSPSFIRYAAYPTLALPQENATPNIKNWVVVERPDIALDPAGRLTLQGKPLTPPGTIVQSLGTDSFLFRAN